MTKLNNKKVIAASLLEWTLGSKTTFAKEENRELAEKAQKLGIELPSPDLAAFETIYCEVDKFNLNRVKVSKKAAEKGIKTLIGKQINWNHEGAHQICGYIIDAFIKEDKIYIDGILFKSLFTAEFGTVIELFESGKLFVSFELWNRKEDGTTIVKDLGDGYRELTEFVAHGCALLLLDQETGKPIPPACPKAQVLKLLATTKIIEEANSIVDKIFEKDERLVYAELALEPEKGGTVNIMTDEIKATEVKTEETKIEEASYECECLKCGKIISSDQHCKDIKCSECGGEMRRKDRPGTGKGEEEKVEEVKTEKKAEEIKAEVKTEETKIEEIKSEEKKEEKAEEAQVTPEPAQVEQTKGEEVKTEAKTEEPVVEVKSEEAIVETPKTEEQPEQAQVVVEQPAEPSKKLVKIVGYDGTETTTLFAEQGEVTSKRRKMITVRYFNDGTEERSESEAEAIETFTYSQLEEKINAAKAEVETKLVEKDTEISNLKKELDAKAQEIAELKTPKVEEVKEEKQPDLTVGTAETKTIDKYVERRKRLNITAYGHESKGQ